MTSLRCAFSSVFLHPMPMEDYGDYEGYWTARSEHSSPLLFRDRFIAHRLPDAGSLLDIGCGDGRFLRHVRSVRPNLALAGIDGSSVAVEHVRASGVEAEVVDVSGKLPAGHFDYITIMEVIEHLPEPERLMQQVRAMQPKAVYVTIPNLGFIVHRLRLALGGKMPVTAIMFHIKEHLRFWTVADFTYWARRLGFEVGGCYAQSPKRLAQWMPSLFSSQVIYELRACQRPEL